MQNTLSIEVGVLDEAGNQEVKFVGEFDKAGFSSVKEQLADLVKGFSGKNLIFNLSGLKFINSEGIGHIMEIHTHLSKADRRLVLVAPNAHVGDVFNAIGMSSVVAVFPSMDAFLNSH